MIKIVAPMTPRPAPRPDSKDKQRYSPKWYRKWKQDFGLFARLAMKGRPPLIGNLKLSALFYKLKPKDPQSKQYGDLDNLIKAVKDAMNGICYVDDSQVTQYGHCGKFHGESQIIIELEEIELSLLRLALHILTLTKLQGFITGATATLTATLFMTSW